MTGFPKILYDNRLKDATPVASSTAAGDYNVLNLRDWKKFTWWKPVSLPATVTVDCGANRAVDYMFLHGGNLFSSRCQAQLWGSTTADFSSGVTAFASTNLIASPDDFSDSVWIKRGSVGVAANDTVAPDGSLTADKITGIGAPGVDDIYQMRDLLLPSSNTYSPSIWIKRISTTGILSLANPWNPAYGELRIDLSLLSNDWERITKDHPAVTVVASFNTIGSALAGIHLFRYSGAGPLSFYAWRAGANAYHTPHTWLNGEIDQPFLALAAPDAPYRYWRVLIGRNTGSAVPSIAIASVGEALDIPSYLREGFDPLGRTIKGQVNRTVGGNPMGRVIFYEDWSEDLKFELLTWDWLRTKFVPAWEAHLRSEPFAFAWDSIAHGDELFLVQAKDQFKTPHKVGGYADLTLPVVGISK